MAWIKIWRHIIALVQSFFYKLVYGGSLYIENGVTWRRNFSIVIEGKGKIHIGNDCFFNNECTLMATKFIDIGQGCLFGENVKIYDHNHKYLDENVPIKQQGYTSEEIIIGEHCWIGSNVTILKGTHIGNNSVIGAGCVVSGIIPQNCKIKPKTEYSCIEIKTKDSIANE